MVGDQQDRLCDGRADAEEDAGVLPLDRLDIIELPSSYPAFGRLKDFELEENTVINFEYLYFGHSVAPYHLESSYLIERDGARCLHTMPHELIVAG